MVATDVAEFVLPDSFSDDIVRAMALQPDRKIVVAGAAAGTIPDSFVVARYLPGGTLDTTFGAGGIGAADFGGSEEAAYGVVVQPDGKIVAVGVSNGRFGHPRIALARYTPSGILDPSFGARGTVITRIGRDTWSQAFAIALQSDDKIVVAGGVIPVSGVHGDVAVVRYRTNGTLDSTFGRNGIVTTDFGDGQAAADALLIQPDGKIVVAGYTLSGGVDIALVRYRADGTLDTTFGTKGLVRTDFGGSREEAYALALQPNGRIIVAGRTIVDDNADVALARYLSNGRLDGSFGQAGIVTTDFAGGYDDAQAIGLQADGKLVLAGTTQGAAGDSDFGLARYTKDGVLDTTFGMAGKVRTNFSGDDGATALVIQPWDGRLVAAGVASVEDLDMALVRYHAITCGGVVVTRIGTPDNDTIVGTSGRNVVFAFGGNDTIYGVGGNDILCGGSGTDTCDGGAHIGQDSAADCEDATGVP
jgi:uncharacterized delta-60 repeat protein